MNRTEYIDEDATESGSSAAELRETARRQLAASIAVVVILAIGGAFAAFATQGPHGEAQVVVAHKAGAVQKPTFATTPDHQLAAARRHELELP